MAKFAVELPTEIMKDFEMIHGNTEKIFGEMTKAGAEVVAGKVRGSVPLEEMASHVKISRTYRTPSDDGINTKVYLSGYIPFTGNRKWFARRGKQGGDVYKTNKGIPVDFLAKIYEYGRSTAPFPKKPFLRRSFSGGAIRKAMLDAQSRASGGLLDE